MTSIKNDAFTVGTAAASAAAASALINNTETIKTAAGAAIKGVKTVNKDTFKKAGKTLGEAAKKSFSKKAFQDLKTKLKGTNLKGIKKLAVDAKEIAAGIGGKTINFVKTNWKFKGAMKAAAVAGVVAAGIVIAKNVAKSIFSDAE